MNINLNILNYKVGIFIVHDYNKSKIYIIYKNSIKHINNNIKIILYIMEKHNIRWEHCIQKMI